MKIGIASDHRGYELKEYLKENLKEYEFVDFGTNSTESVDYPDFAFALSTAVVDKKVDYGIAICGSGIGISIACNKVKGIRCAKVSNKEEAKYTREDNDANIIAFGEKIDKEEALQAVRTFIETPFTNLEKHIRRINKTPKKKKIFLLFLGRFFYFCPVVPVILILSLPAKSTKFNLPTFICVLFPSFNSVVICSTVITKTA